MNITTMSQDDFHAHCDDDNGICLDCGAIREGNTEPDAENYPCDDCGKRAVVGMETALAMGIIEFDDED